MKSVCVGVLSIIELKNARRNIEIVNTFTHLYFLWRCVLQRELLETGL